MSPVSRGRKVKQKRKSAQRPAGPYVSGRPDECNCPSCSGVDADPQRVLDDLIEMSTGLTESQDPLESEMAGATVMSLGARIGAGFEDALIGGLLPELESRATAETLAILLAIGSVADDRVAEAASAAVARLVEAGDPLPGWAAELGEPVTFADCLRLSDSEGTASILVCSFHRAGRTHAIVMSVDDEDCGAASDILLLDVEELYEVLEMMRAAGRRDGLTITTKVLDAAEFRWQVEKALDARAFHDAALMYDELDQMSISEDGLPYPALGVLLRARMKTLPTPSKPPVSHGADNASLFDSTARQVLARMPGEAGSPFGARTAPSRRGRTTAPALPPKRKKPERPAPIYQIKVALRGAKPPIWRRLEVPADISLARLHTIIQIAFGWDDSHLHVFETPYGSFGNADTDRGRREETSATLEQVAPAVNSKVTYTYDFGDDWAHEIVVEKVFASSEAAAYPRCTGGRRAAPPDDCGGVWGYAQLLEVLNDPTDEEHEDRLEWLGLDDPAQFDADEFDVHAVTRAMSLVS